MSNILDSHVEAYEGHSLYDFDNSIQLNWYPRRIIQLVQNSNSILELGLGHGVASEVFSHFFARHVVIEASSAVINNFRMRFPDCHPQIIESYFEDYESPERFDVIVLGFILEHVDDPNKILTHYKKFLSAQGKMFVTVPNAEVLNRRLGYLAGILPDIHELSEHDLLCGHKRYFTLASLTQEVENAGYKVAHVEGIYLKPFTTSQIKSLEFNDRILEALCTVGKDYPELCCGILAQIESDVK